MHKVRAAFTTPITTIYFITCTEYNITLKIKDFSHLNNKIFNKTTVKTYQMKKSLNSLNLFADIKSENPKAIVFSSTRDIRQEQKIKLWSHGNNYFSTDFEISLLLHKYYEVL